MTLNLILRPDGSFLLLYSGFLCRFFASAGGPTSLDNISIFFLKRPGDLREFDFLLS